MKAVEVRAVLVVAVIYLVIGRVPVPAELAWRLAAWVASGVAYAAHIWYEHHRLRNPPRSIAWHAALAVAIGAFLLAGVGLMRSWSTGTGIGILGKWLIALVAWPAITAIPAFLGALVAGAVLARLSRRAERG